MANPIGNRTPSWIAWSMCASTLALIVCAITFSVLNRHETWELLFLIAEATGALVGFLVASRRPHNPVGWFIAGHALCFSLGEFARQYAIYGLLTAPGTLPLAGAVASLAYWVWYPSLILVFALLPLYFPDGRLASRRWRPVAWFAFFVIVVVAGLTAIAPGDIEIPGFPNPLGIESLQPFGETVDAVVVMLLLSVGLMSATSMVVRFRRSRGEVRQQIKWFVYAVVLNVFSFPVVNLFLHSFSPVLSAVLHLIGLGSLWIAIAFAILKYRLYDIDLIINRTLVYGVLTVMLAAFYFGGVTATQALFQTLTGQEKLSQLVIVASTLAIAAVFNPLRCRVQAFVDRRFYRNKYDARRTLETFSTHMRDETDLNALSDDLVGVVSETMQPTHVSLLLRPETSSKGEQERRGGARFGASPLSAQLIPRRDAKGD